MIAHHKLPLKYEGKHVFPKCKMVCEWMSLVSPSNVIHP